MFFRISCNVLDGVLVMCIASLCGAPLWLSWCAACCSR